MMEKKTTHTRPPTIATVRLYRTTNADEKQHFFTLPVFCRPCAAGDVAYVQGYIMSVAGAVTNAGSDGKTLLHCVSLLG